MKTITNKKIYKNRVRQKLLVQIKNFKFDKGRPIKLWDLGQR